ncbi:response regulator [Archaeoglobus veneficus]|uniref:Response regulator receiver protein n=1 Tax=Archaeoglobus veneficus (strain DSM 11195 / SNP6) TaxID=693661 RepID=F2KNK1_ARCVS|nr:response regulator [Archaeoglobus veneficus]AEA46229.1 response regulator receiver protein [Archaeoglobus veneficus SNP6]
MGRKKNVKILIVDDEPAIREVMRLILKNYDVIEAANGIEALKMCEEHKPDLILMDIMMPRMNGIEATKAILERFPNAKIVAVTAYATHKGKEMLEAGAVDILEKPFGRKKLEELVEKIVGKENEKNEVKGQ